MELYSHAARLNLTCRALSQFDLVKRLCMRSLCAFTHKLKVGSPE